ncbi:hypothetical protein ACFYT3_31830 [Nocardia amikacinitolerans]|uniref:hypothetical protein n=1 Tax=Nocardia amikacinitolerans TaxID=756689 RepID=UPI0036A83E29
MTYLREKGNTGLWQPVSPTLMQLLLRHRDRGSGDPDTQLLRYRSGRPITHRRFDNIWERVGRHLPWVAVHQISTLWIRHTTITWVERNFSNAVASAYAHHAPPRGTAGATLIYTVASLPELAAALSVLVGEPHPLADTEYGITDTESFDEAAAVPLVTRQGVPPFRRCRVRLLTDQPHHTPVNTVPVAATLQRPAPPTPHSMGDSAHVPTSLTHRPTLTTNRTEAPNAR